MKFARASLHLAALWAVLSSYEASAQSTTDDVRPYPADHSVAAARQSTEQAPAGLPPLEEDTELRWYGWQTLIADGLSLVLLPTPTAALGLLTACFGPALIHASHGNWTEALGSLMLRFLAAGLVVSGVSEVVSKDGEGDPLLLIAGALTVLGAVVLDAAVFGYVRDRRARERTHIDVVPWTHPRGDAGLAIAARL